MRNVLVLIAGIAAALALSGGAGATRPLPSGGCVLGGDTTVNYLGGTSEVDIYWYADVSRTTLIGESLNPISARKPGSVSAPTPDGAAIALVAIFNPNSPSFTTLCS